MMSFQGVVSMSIRTIVQCDNDKCQRQVDTVNLLLAPPPVPKGWITIRQQDMPIEHYCGKICLIETKYEGLEDEDTDVSNSN